MSRNYGRQPGGTHPRSLTGNLIVRVFEGQKAAQTPHPHPPPYPMLRHSQYTLTLVCFCPFLYQKKNLKSEELNILLRDVSCSHFPGGRPVQATWNFWEPKAAEVSTPLARSLRQLRGKSLCFLASSLASCPSPPSAILPAAAAAVALCLPSPGDIPESRRNASTSAKIICCLIV